MITIHNNTIVSEHNTVYVVYTVGSAMNAEKLKVELKRRIFKFNLQHTPWFSNAFIIHEMKIANENQTGVNIIDEPLNMSLFVNHDEYIHQSYSNHIIDIVVF